MTWRAVSITVGNAETVKSSMRYKHMRMTVQVSLPCVSACQAGLSASRVWLPHEPTYFHCESTVSRVNLVRVDHRIPAHGGIASCPQGHCVVVDHLFVNSPIAEDE